MRVVLERPLRPRAAAEFDVSRPEVRQHRGAGEQVADEDGPPTERTCAKRTKSGRVYTRFQTFSDGGCRVSVNGWVTASSEPARPSCAWQPTQCWIGGTPAACERRAYS